MIRTVPSGSETRPLGSKRIDAGAPAMATLCETPLRWLRISFVASVATRGIVLDSGRAIAYGRVDEILADPRVREAYFGVLT